MKFITSMDLPGVIILFVISTIIIAIGGSRLSREADRLADLTGLGEAFVGAIFLGAATSIAGLVTSFTAAIENHPHLSISNAIGGIAAQTVFLAFADISYKKANLEHASASLSNIMQGIILIFLLALILIVRFTPEINIIWVHPVSFLLVVIYIISQRMITKSRKIPMWKAVKTSETKEDIPEEANIKNYKLRTVVARFVLLGIVIAFSGFLIAQSAIVIASKTGISENIVGAFFTSVSSSLPELIVSLAAVRQKALTLAVSNIIGGNTFDLLFVSFSDFGYREGSIIHTFQSGQIYLILLTILLTAILTLGLLFRQKKGLAKIGWESTLLIVVFFLGYILLALM
jgi:cation:H+ antiporter